MPQKPPPRTRAWGTRFDSLLSSPPLSPHSGEDTITQNTTGISLSDGKEHTPENPHKKSDEKMPHDASVFVGSLPSNVDQPDLARMLSEHLSEHAEVKNVKVVRDSKGGVCAFVQCEDASSAARLIHTIHSREPKPFMGRFLRYEPARAFRTLLISYRAPVQFIPPTNAAADVVSNNQGKTIQLDPPTSMTLWRPRNTKFLNILYNAEACNFDSQNLLRSQGFGPESPNGSNLFLNPVSFDENTIQRLALFFGPLEIFRAFRNNNLSHDNEAIDTVERSSESASTPYPSPHDATRLAQMHPGCWEIKWDHRDDCVSALMTLRRVPHLTVTWAHQPASYGYDQHQFQFQNQRFAHPNGASYPYHVEDLRVNQGFFHHPHRSPNFGFSGERNTMPPKPSGLTVATVETNTIPQLPDSKANGQHSDQPPQDNLVVTEEGTFPDVKKVGWTETDFPPLCDLKGDRRVENGVWSEKKAASDKEDVDATPQSPISVLATPRVAVMPLLTSEAIPIAFQTGDQDEGQDVDMLPTPDFGRSPITPQTPGSQFPETPTTGDLNGDFESAPFKYDYKERTYFGDAHTGEREIDRTTIFVGGLEMNGPNAWDEGKVQSFFSKFGGIETVKVVRPVNGRAAFAFVKFNNSESPARAVCEEHNRVYEGRQLRVQLRDCNPPNRGTWRYRGRGRYPHYVSSRQLVDPPVDSRCVMGLGMGSKPDQFENHSSDATSQHADLATAKDGLIEIATSSTVDGDGKSEPFRPMEGGNTAGGDEQCTDDTLHHKLAANVQPIGSRISSPAQSSTNATWAGYEHYREWYQQDPPSAPLTPPSSSFGSSTSALLPAMAYPLQNAAMFPPQPWMQTYAQQLPYTMPFIPAYPGYAMQNPVPQVYPSSASSDTSGHTPATVNPWAGVGSVYTPFMPYPAYHIHAQSTDPTQAPPSHSQAPLVPTSFIQGDQGTLIPVYHPEALDHYMSGDQTTPPPQPQLLQSSSYPYHTPISHTSFPMLGLPSQQFAMNQGPPQPGVSVAWNSGPPIGVLGSHQSPHHLPQVPFNTPNRPPVSVIRGPYAGVGPAQPLQQRHVTPPPRRYQRRDQQNTLTGNNIHRNNHHSRGGISNSRFSRGGMTNGDSQHDYGPPPQLPQSLPAHPVYNSASGLNGWTQWSSGR